MKSVVVVGASLAGLRAAETLRREGFDGRLSLVGAEPHLPYDRVQLSTLLVGVTVVFMVLLTWLGRGTGSKPGSNA